VEFDDLEVDDCHNPCGTCARLSVIHLTSFFSWMSSSALRCGSCSRDSVPSPGACTANSNIDIVITFLECLDPATNLGPRGERIAHRAINRGSAGAHCPDGQQLIPTLQEFFTFGIPDNVGCYAGTSSLTFAGHDGPVPYNNIHADYFNAEEMTKLVEFCINGKNAGSPNCK
jgi:hypothetical protein